jgi:hypothetical protein
MRMKPEAKTEFRAGYVLDCKISKYFTKNTSKRAPNNEFRSTFKDKLQLKCEVN